MANKILWVDDVKDFLDLMEMEIIKRGFQFVPAYNGVEGLEKAKIEKPDLIFLDIMMPIMDGFEMFKQLKDSSEYNQAPVIMVSAKNDQETELRNKLDKMIQEYMRD